MAMAMDNSNKYPCGSTVAFPYDSPYPQQVALMDALLEGIKEQRLLCLESPTGTGKSLSLACASLAWLEFMENKEKQENEETNETITAAAAAAASTSTVPATATTSTGTSTNLSWLEEWQPNLEQATQERQRQRQQLVKQKERQRQDQLIQVLESLRKETPNNDCRENLARQAIAKARMTARKRQRQRQHQKNPSLQYEDDEEKTFSKPEPVPGTPEWLLQPPPKQYQIIYAARTHSQLSQFIGEVRKTKWGNTTRVVALGSRSQGLCGFLSSKKLSEQAMTEQCLDLRQSKKRTSTGSTSCACPYYQPSAIATLALHSLATPTDLEDMIHLGKTTQTCAYYATRQAISQAQLIVVPYSILIDQHTRQSIGLNLKNSLVLIDEAHNLPQAIEAITSAKVSMEICQAAYLQLERYTNKYLLEQDRLNARHAQLLGQLKVFLKGMKKSMQASKSLLAIPQYLCSYKLDSINLFPILRYLQDSRLSQKLLGFMKDPKEAKESSPTESSAVLSTLSSHISPMSVVESFLTKMNTFEQQHAKLVVGNNMLELVVLNPAVHAQDDLYKLPHAVCLVGGTLQPFHILIQELVPALSQEAKLAQSRIQSNTTQTSIVYQSPSFVGFSCGHVVSPDHILLQALTNVGATTLDLRHQTRSLPVVLQAIGQGILKLCQTVPHGVVVFVPSYSYEQVLVQSWKTTKLADSTSTVWDSIFKAKPIFREPKQRTQMEQVLQDYAKTAESTRQGALLIAVVGGKLSEGINFADRLCRCVVVVGLPYADKSDPVLQEKLKFQHQDYYQSLCLRAVNQSVGRAIRHHQDYAAIVLMDARYRTDSGIAKGLPKWLTSSTPTWRQQSGHLENVLMQIEQFFQNPKFRED